MKKLENVPTIGAPDSEYLKGYIDPGVTKVSSDIYHDVVETMHKMVGNVGVTENDVKDNETNGHQMLQAIEFMAKSRHYHDSELTVAVDKTLTLPATYDIGKVYGVANGGHRLEKIIIPVTMPANNIFSVYIYFVDGGKFEKGFTDNCIDIGDLDNYNIPELTLVEFTKDNSVSELWIPKILWSNSYSKDMIQRKIVVLKGWNMDTIATYEVDHNVPDGCLIVGCQATILSDTGVQYPLNCFSSGAVQGGVSGYNLTAGTISFTRLAGGLFDSSEFDDTKIKRGYAVIDFISAQ